MRNKRPEALRALAAVSRRKAAETVNENERRRHLRAAEALEAMADEKERGR